MSGADRIGIRWRLSFLALVPTLVVVAGMADLAVTRNGHVHAADAVQCSANLATVIIELDDLAWLDADRGRLKQATTSPLPLPLARSSGAAERLDPSLVRARAEELQRCWPTSDSIETLLQDANAIPIGTATPAAEAAGPTARVDGPRPAIRGATALQEVVAQAERELASLPHGGDMHADVNLVRSLASLLTASRTQMWQAMDVVQSASAPGITTDWMADALASLASVSAVRSVHLGDVRRLQAQPVDPSEATFATLLELVEVPPSDPDDRAELTAKLLIVGRNRQAHQVAAATEATRQWAEHAADGAGAARRGRNLATGAGLLATLLTAGCALAIARSIAKPLGQLEARTRSLDDCLQAAPEPMQGPPEIRRIGAALDDVAVGLRSLQAETEVLARGEVDLAALDGVTPGRLGGLVRASVERMAQVTADLRASEALANAVVESAADAVWVLDGTGRIRSANKATVTLLRRAVVEQIGESFSAVLASPGLLDDLAAGRSIEGDHDLLDRDGYPVAVRLAGRPVATDGDLAFAVFAHDIRQYRRLERQLTYQARHDPLTGLPNRVEVMRRIEIAMLPRERHGSAERVAVLFIDLDGFKQLNDTYGHHVGDEVLKHCAERFGLVLRSGDVVARLGGDEFVVVSRSIESDAVADRLAARLIAQMDEPFTIGKISMSLTASIGVACAQVGTCSAEEILEHADAAVYAAKAAGKGRAEVYGPALAERLGVQRNVEQALREALVSDDLELHYQPIVDIVDGSVWGVEALVRWNRSGHGMLAPNQFVPIAERSNLALDLDRWVLHQACRQLRSWCDEQSLDGLAVSVNVSARSMGSDRLIGDVEAALVGSGIDAKQLQIELTETHLPDDPAAVGRMVRALRDLGVTVAIDDFGTGFTSIASLRHLRVDRLKVDRSLVAGLAENGNVGDQSIVELLISVSEVLKLDVVAEGVETVEQLDLLRSIGCRHVQGYLLGRPMRAQDVLVDLQRRHDLQGGLSTQHPGVVS